MYVYLKYLSGCGLSRNHLVACTEFQAGMDQDSERVHVPATVPAVPSVLPVHARTAAMLGFSGRWGWHVRGCQVSIKRRVGASQSMAYFICSPR